MRGERLALSYLIFFDFRDFFKVRPRASSWSMERLWRTMSRSMGARPGTLLTPCAPPPFAFALRGLDPALAVVEEVEVSAEVGVAVLPVEEVEEVVEVSALR
jgi:hypothetical protein